MIKKIVKSFKKKSGFTLAELVVTTAVMGTLAAVAVPRFSDVNEIAKERKTMSSIDNVLSAGANYYNETTVTLGRGRFPGQATFRSDVIASEVFKDSIFVSLYGGQTVASPYEEGVYTFSVTGGTGSGKTATSPTLIVWDTEDSANLRKTFTP